jgi:hypothetical protein
MGVNDIDAMGVGDIGAGDIVLDGVEISKVLDELEEARCFGGTPHSRTNIR